jgi:hypothetical protein
MPGGIIGTMRLRARAVALLFVPLAVACVGEGGHCLNPQPDLPCGSADTTSKAGAGPTASGPSAAPPPVLGSGGASASGGAPSLNVSFGGSGGASAEQSPSSAAEAGAAGAAGDAAGAAGDSEAGAASTAR